MKELRTLERLADSFSKLPGVGMKGAERMAYAVLNMSDEDIKEFSYILSVLKEKIHKCPICGLYTEDDICEICSDADRTNDTLIVVSYAKDVFAFEKLGKYKGKYHVLGGAISPSQGVSVSDLNIDSLIERIKKDNVKEIVLATNPTVEGETTALYVARLLKDLPIEITRLAYGLPMGGHLDYADSLTLDRALEGRRKL